jgi:hypothetical protein
MQLQAAWSEASGGRANACEQALWHTWIWWGAQWAQYWRVQVRKLMALATVWRGAAERRERRESVAGVDGAGERAQKELRWRASA